MITQSRTKVFGYAELPCAEAGPNACDAIAICYGGTICPGFTGPLMKGYHDGYKYVG